MKVWGCQSEFYDAATATCSSPGWYDLPSWVDMFAGPNIAKVAQITGYFLFVCVLLMIFRILIRYFGSAESG